MGRITARLSTYDPALDEVELTIAENVPDSLSGSALEEWVTRMVDLPDTVDGSSAPIKGFWTDENVIPFEDVSDAMKAQFPNEFLEREHGVTLIGPPSRVSPPLFTYISEVDPATVPPHALGVGVRSTINDNNRFGNNSNALASIRAMLQKPEKREEVRKVFALSRHHFSAGDYEVNSTDKFIHFINNMACVQFALFMRYGRCKIIAVMSQWLGGSIYGSDEFAYPSTMRSGGTGLLASIVDGLFGPTSDGDVFDRLGKPVSTKELHAFCKQRKVYLVMLQKSSLNAYRAAVADEYEHTAVISDNAYHTVASKFKMHAVLGFCPEMANKKNVKLQGVVMWMSDENHDMLHCNPLLDATLCKDILKTNPACFSTLIRATAEGEIREDMSEVMVRNTKCDRFVTDYVYDSKQLDAKGLGLHYKMKGLLNTVYVEDHPQLQDTFKQVESLMELLYTRIGNAPIDPNDRATHLARLSEEVRDHPGSKVFLLHDKIDRGEVATVEKYTVSNVFEHLYGVAMQRWNGFFNFDDFSLGANNRKILANYRVASWDLTEPEPELARVTNATGVLNFTVKLTNPVTFDVPDSGESHTISGFCEFLAVDVPKVKLCERLIRSGKLYSNTIEQHVVELGKEVAKRREVPIVDGIVPDDIYAEVIENLDFHDMAIVASRRNLMFDALVDDKETNHILHTCVASSEIKQEEELSFNDPCYDEIIAHKSTMRSSFPLEEDTVHEVDFNRFYTSILCMQTFIQKLPEYTDDYGEIWVPGGCPNPNKYELTYECEDYLSSFTFDSGYCFIEEVNWDYALSEFPKVFSDHSSWMVFSKAHKTDGTHVSRYVTTGSVISLCLQAAQGVNDPIDRETIFKDIQRLVLNIRIVKLNLTRDERQVLKTCAMTCIKQLVENAVANERPVPSSNLRVNKHKGALGTHVPLLQEKAYGMIVHGGYDGIGSSGRIKLPAKARTFREVATKCAERLAEIAEEEEEFTSKYEVNIMIGQMKGDTRIASSISRVKDILPNGSKDAKHLRQWKAMHCVLVPSNQVQLYQYPLPEYSARLVETVSVKPRVARNTLRGLRAYILDVARTIMDIVVMQTNDVIATKVDACFVTSQGRAHLMEFFDKMGVPHEENVLGGVHTKEHEREGIYRSFEWMQQAQEKPQPINHNVVAKEKIKIMPNVKAMKCSDLLSFEGTTKEKIAKHFETFWENPDAEVYQNYRDNCLEVMNTLGSFVLEGSPGCGKSRMVKSFIEHWERLAQEQEEDVETPTYKRYRCNIPRNIIIATATHATVAQFKEFEELECVKFVGTMHSLAGVHTSFECFKGDIRKHFETNERARFSGLKRNYFFDDAEHCTLIVDEFEMLNEDAFLLLKYLKEVKHFDIVLVGDKKQTAHFSAGVQPDNSIVRYITDYNYLEADVQFRNNDPAFYERHKVASSSNPSLFLGAPMSEYAVLQPRSEGWNQLAAKFAAEYLDAMDKKVFFDRTMVSVPDYKLATYLICHILDEMYAQAGESLKEGCMWHIGKLSLKYSPRKVIENNAAGGLFRRRRTDNPAGKLFYVGTRMLLCPGMTYVAIEKHNLRIYTNEEEVQRKKRLGKVFQGEYVMFVRRVTIPVASLWDNGSVVTDIEPPTHLLEFQSKARGTIYLMEEDFERHFFYPFCQYSGSSVGHTYESYYYFNRCATPNNSYSRHKFRSLKDRLKDTETEFLPDECGVEHLRYMSEFVRGINVAVSRTTGSLTRFFDVMQDDNMFWEPYLNANDNRLLRYENTEEAREAFVKRACETAYPDAISVLAHID